MGNLVSVKNLIKYYGKNLVIDNANIDIEENKIIGLLGPNGCGKTTIMKILAGLISDYSGEVLIDGKKPGAETKAIVSFLPDHSAVPEWMSVRQIIDYYADFFADFDSDKAEKIAERFALKPNIKYKAMSKGMQERLQIDLAISRRARLYLLDEPLGGVDPAARSSILDVILENYLDNSTILISTHMVHDVERIFDRVIMLGYGKIALEDDVESLRQQYGKSIDEIFREVFKCCVNY